MPRFDRMQTLNLFFEQGMVPVFHHADAEVVLRVATALAEGGARLLEFTNRGDGAVQTFATLEAHCRAKHPELAVGVGSVVDAPTAAAYINLGASFVVGPVLNPEAARVCNRRKVPYMPGCGSASEISLAEELGCEIVKIFPAAQVGGPAFVKSLLGPCPWSRIMPTGGVQPTEESLSAWFGAGVACVGIGSELITKEILERGDYAALRARVGDGLALVKRLRAVKS